MVMNLTWLIGIIFTIVLGSLALNMPIKYRAIIALILILIAIICYVANSYYALKQKFYAQQKSRNKKDKELQECNEQLKNSIFAMNELVGKLRELVEKNNIIDNDIELFLDNQTQTTNEISSYIEVNNKQEEIIKINVKSEEELVSFLEKLESGKVVIFYEDDDRDARIKYGYDGLWEFYYFRKGFETTIRDFSLNSVINNNYFKNAVSWIEPKNIDRTNIEQFKAFIIDYNSTYDMIVIENYPQNIYHYVMLKERGEHLADLCDDCRYTGKHNSHLVSIHKGYPLNFQVAKRVGFNVDYLSEKFRISEAEAYFMAKILKNNFGLKFKELND